MEDNYDEYGHRAREVEIVFEKVLDLNNKYGTQLDKYMQKYEVKTLQDLEDCIGTWYNNFNANVEGR